MTEYRLGLPAWAFDGWEGRYFDGADRLRQYASVFGTVEGNTTFYATPSPRTVDEWRAQLAGLDFRFCFKLPRIVTHEPGGRRALAEFLHAIEPLMPWLGPFLVQLPASVGPDKVDWIRGLLAALPDEIGHALEVRHPDFFTAPETFDEHFAGSGCLRTIMDARPIHREHPSHPEVLAARHEKPDVPVHARTSSGGALVRLVLHPDDSLNVPYYDFWAEQVDTWRQDGRRVLMMIHCPNNLHCPPQAKRFHDLLRARSAELAPLPDWPLTQGTLF